MPDLSATEGSDILVKLWLVPEGARVRRGEPLVEVETDKATTEVESLAAGIVAEILAHAGSKPRPRLGVSPSNRPAHRRARPTSAGDQCGLLAKEALSGLDSTCEPRFAPGALRSPKVGESAA